jgi:anti-sigma-K factor RskA
MDYSRRELADRLAAEYVLGTLRGPARRRLEALLPAHPTLRAAVTAWETRLMPLAEVVPPVTPRAIVFERLHARLFGQPAAPAPWWQRLALWQGLSALAVAGVVGMAVLQTAPREDAPPIVVVLASADAAGAVPASFVASLSGDGSTLVLKPVQVGAIGSARSFELWAVPASGAPRSLGLVSASSGATVRRAGLLRDTNALAVSLEPQGGSPTGAPTGPIVALGKVQL